MVKPWIRLSLIAFFLSYSPISIDACTDFCLDTPEGPVFGCNLDLFFPGDGLVFINRRGIAKKGFDPGTTGQVAEWVSKYGSVTFNLAGREWAFGGMNEAGLVIGGMELLPSRFPAPDERPPLPIGPWAQYVLDTCENVAEAIEVDQKVRIEDPATAIHFLVADAEGDCAVIEWYEGSLVCRTGDDLPVKALSNSFYDEALAAYRRGGPRWWESDRGDTNRRFTDAALRNNEFKDSGQSNVVRYALETLTDVVGAPHTKWNIVYHIPKRTVYFRSAASPALKYLSLEEFDLSCSAPLLMLDINTGQTGNVAKALVPYDHDVNRLLFKTLCARYGVILTDESVDEIMEHVESFECAP